MLAVPACPPWLQGENPVYLWVPLAKPKRRREKGIVDDEVSDLQVGGWLGGLGGLGDHVCLAGRRAGWPTGWLAEWLVPGA